MLLILRKLDQQQGLLSENTLNGTMDVIAFPFLHRNYILNEIS